MSAREDTEPKVKATSSVSAVSRGTSSASQGSSVCRWPRRRPCSLAAAARRFSAAPMASAAVWASWRSALSKSSPSEI